MAGLTCEDLAVCQHPASQVEEAGGGLVSLLVALSPAGVVSPGQLWARPAWTHLPYATLTSDTLRSQGRAVPLALAAK